MQDWLAARAPVRPKRIALHIGSNQWTYGELDRMASETAALLLSLGVQPGDRVAVLMLNSVEYVGVIFAAMRLGAVLVPLNARLTKDELAYQVEKVGAKLLLCHSQTEEAADPLSRPGLSVISMTDIGSHSALLKAQPSIKPREINLSEPLAIVFTSGTSGKPKGAVLSYGAFYHSANASAYRLGTMHEDRWLCVLPLYHVGGLSLLLRAVLYGISVDLFSSFDAEAINYRLSMHPVTLISLVPTMLHRLLAVREDALWSKLRCILLGGAAASHDLILRAADAGAPVATTYGLTEAASQVATTFPGEAIAKPGTVGKPLMFTNMRIIDSAGQDLPPGEIGEIVVKGMTLMSEYYGEPEATAQALRGGELYTGDLGYLDEQGDLFIVQRRSDLIVSGGENVYPAEVEAILRQYPGVQEVCVVGLPDEEWGQRVAAALTVKEGTARDPGPLLAFAREHLAGYKLPRRVLFVDALPMTASGKIQRSAVGDLFK